MLCSGAVVRAGWCPCAVSRLSRGAGDAAVAWPERQGRCGTWLLRSWANAEAGHLVKEEPLHGRLQACKANPETVKKRRSISLKRSWKKRGVRKTFVIFPSSYRSRPHSGNAKQLRALVASASWGQTNACAPWGTSGLRARAGRQDKDRASSRAAAVPQTLRRACNERALADDPDVR